MAAPGNSRPEMVLAQRFGIGDPGRHCLNLSDSLEHSARPVLYQPGLLGITKIWPGKTRLGSRI
jgi:hypothetical protein